MWTSHYSWKRLPEPEQTFSMFVLFRAAERLLSLHVVPGLDACTYMGLDSGAKPIHVSYGI